MSVAVCVLALTMVPIGAADAQHPPFNHGVTDARVDQAMEADHFADVHLGQVHSESIDCLWFDGVGQGGLVDGQDVYEPGGDVNRQQMASFIARAMDHLVNTGVLLPMEFGQGTATSYELPRSTGRRATAGSE